ncbi:MAG: mechanosensitive ion channel family protein, partial [Bdellovibrionota bacterium]
MRVSMACHYNYKFRSAGRLLRAALILISFATISARASAQTADLTTEGKPLAATGAFSKLPTAETDQEILEFLSKVSSQTTSMANIKVGVQSGIVTLRGRVETAKDAQWLSNLVNRLPGVLAVVNEVEVSAAVFTELSPMWNEVDRLADRLKRHIPAILFAIAFLLISYFLSSLLSSLVRALWGKKIANPFLLSTVSRLTLLPIWVLLFYLGLRILGLSTLGATLIGGTSVLGIVLGLAFKGIAENYLAGLLLASRSPFTRGDLIQIGPYHGYVENLNMRGTTIIDLNGNLILIPNLTVIQSVVENQTANPHTRTTFSVGIGYQDSIRKAQDLIIKAVSEVEGVLPDPPPSVVVKALASTNVELSVRIWFNSRITRELRIKSRAMIQVKETLLANGITIPGDVRELLFTNSLKLENVTAAPGAESEHQHRKNEIKKQAALNLAEPESTLASVDPSPEQMLEQAAANPLPTNSDSGLL